MTLAGFFHSESTEKIDEKNLKKRSEILNKPPVPNARLGLDEQGNPAWFAPKTNENDEYTRIDL